MREAQLHPERPTVSGSIEDSGPAGNGPAQLRDSISSQTHCHRAPFGARPAPYRLVQCRACPPISMACGAPPSSREIERAAPISLELGRETTLLESALTSLFPSHPRLNSFGIRTYITAGGYPPSSSVCNSLTLQHLDFGLFDFRLPARRMAGPSTEREITHVT